MDIANKISKLKKERQAIILAHNYTVPAVQDIADFVGDSLELSIKAKACEAPVIVFCGVRFMAETAKILSPHSTVLHPSPHAGCPMADMASAEAVREYKREHPETILVAYVNTTAATKTVVDICCTSGNAERVIASVPADKEIMFLPDANLGSNLARKLGRPLKLWPGFCPPHNKILPETVQEARQKHPQATVLVHPECRPAVVELANHALSTGGMLKFVRESSQKSFIIGTESGLIYRMQQENPDKEFFALSPEIVCPNMKKITLESVLFALEDMAPAVELDRETLEKARLPIERMLELA